MKEIKQRLEELRQELRKQRISYSELTELQSLSDHIDPNDVELLEAAGIPEELSIELKARNNKHIWEGWTVQDFIDDLEVTFPYQTFKTKEEVKQWCQDEQPYYKKYIPEVVNHFIKKARL